jgi:TRAP-type C4-dicarboxylate transport system substrate-binding protein
MVSVTSSMAQTFFSREFGKDRQRPMKNRLHYRVLNSLPSWKTHAGQFIITEVNMKPSKINCYKTRTGFIISLWVVLAILVMIPSGFAATQTGKQITLTLVSAWPRGSVGTELGERLIKEINEENAGVLQIKILGTIEVTPPFEQLESLKRGAYDLIYNSPAFYTKLVPGAIAEFYVQCSPVVLRKTGFLKIYDDMHRKQADVTYLGNIGRGEQFAIYLRKPIDKADLSGLKIRGVPFFDPLVKALGGQPTVIPFPESYSALQRGIVDGAICPLGPIILDNRWYEVLKYIIYPKLPWDSVWSLLANAKRWDALPDRVKKIIMDKVLQIESIAYDFHRKMESKWLQQLLDKGMEIHELPPEEGKKMINVARTVTWEYAEKLDPVYVPQLKEKIKDYLK